MNRKKYLILAIILSLLIPFFSSAEDTLQTAESNAKAGDYKSAYEILLKVYTSEHREFEESKQMVEFYRNKLQGMETNPQIDTTYERSETAKRLWRAAWDTQRTAVFKKVGREKEEMLEDAVSKYREITVNYPETKEAEEAQYRIGRIYIKFLKNKPKGKEEFNKYLELYPQGEYADEIKHELGS